MKAHRISHGVNGAARSSRRLVLATTLVALSLGAFPTSPAQAVGPHTWWVAPSGTAATPADTGSSCANPSYVGSDHTTIQAAIAGATAGDEIKICEGTYAVSTTLPVDKALTLTGVGSQLPVLDGGGTTRIMDITTGGFGVTINRLHFRNGRAIMDQSNNDFVGGGAGIRARTDITLTVNDSLFVNNVADMHGGGIAMFGVGSNSGSVQVDRSTFYKNRALDGGGVLVVVGGATSNITNSTFVGNSATRQGGAVNGTFSDVNLKNSTLIDNTSDPLQGGNATWVVSHTGNLVAYTSSVTPTGTVCDNGPPPVNNVSTSGSCLANPGDAVSAASLALGFLAPWGGPVPTFSIGSGSSAIDAVTSGCPSSDQRGISRSGAPCDAGAFEFVPNAPSLTASSSSITLAQGRAITAAPTFTNGGLTDPVVFRVVSELDGNVPGGVSFSSSNGLLTGTPASTYRSNSLVISATGANGAVANVRLIVDNCILSQSNGKYVISNRNDLELFRLGVCGLDADYVQTADIAWNAAWEGPASSASPFTGAYDGGGHSITGLQISGGGSAFLSNTNGAVIENLAFEVSVSGAYATAGLIQYAVNTTIDRVEGSGTVSIIGEEGCHGGLVGDAYGSTITESSFEGTIDAPDSSWNGGLVGCPWSFTVIERSYFEGTVNGVEDVGGLVGWMSEVDIRDSYAIGSVESSGDGIGGLVGWLELDATDVDTVAVSNSYASTTIDGVTTIGALIGEGESISVSNSFWEDGLAGVAGLDPIGVMSDAGTQPVILPTSATSMKSWSFFDTAGWAIVDGWSDPTTSQDVWGICDGEGRPFLLWQYSSDPCVTPQQPSPQPNNPVTPGPSAPSTPPTTTPTTPTRPAVDPQVPAGGFATVVGGRLVESNLTWSGGSRIGGRIGSIDVMLSFGPPVAGTNSPAPLSPGAAFRLVLNGLKPRSTATATIFSTPTSLGEFVVDASGALAADFAIPRNIEAGAHRLRFEMTGANGEAIVFWVGVNVGPSQLQLPATGSEDTDMAVVATWLLVIGIGMAVSARRRLTLRGPIHPTE